VRSIARNLAVAVALLAGCATSHAPSASSGSAAASPAAGLSVSSARTESGVFIATAAAPPDWTNADALSRGDDLTTLIDHVRAKHATGPVRVEVTIAGRVVATAESPKNGRVTFSMKR